MASNLNFRSISVTAKMENDQTVKKTKLHKPVSRDLTITRTNFNFGGYNNIGTIMYTEEAELVPFLIAINVMAKLFSFLSQKI